jgi:hypothetical protein
VTTVRLYDGTHATIDFDGTSPTDHGARTPSAERSASTDAPVTRSTSSTPDRLRNPNMRSRVTVMPGEVVVET